MTTKDKLEQLQMKWLVIKLIKDGVDHNFLEVIGDDPMHILERVPKSELGDFCLRSLRLSTALRGWDSSEDFFETTNIVVSIPDGTDYRMCPKCKTIVRVTDHDYYEAYVDGVHLCPKCAMDTFGAELNSDSVSPGEEGYEGLLNYLKWEKIYWSDSIGGVLYRKYVKTQNHLRSLIYKTFHRKEWKAKLKRLGLE
jgi:hypothetical protein